MTLLDLLIEIRDSEIWTPTKYDYNRGIGEPMKLARAYDLIEEYGRRGGNYRLTKNAYQVIGSKGDLSVLSRQGFSIQSENTHIGDNFGTYNQSSSEKTKYIEAKTEIPTIKKIFIRIFIAVVVTIITWYLTTYILIG